MIEDVLSVEDEKSDLKFDNNEQKKRFHATLYDVVNDPWWCYQHGINYVNPNIKLAAKLLYDGLFSERNRMV